MLREQKLVIGLMFLLLGGFLIFNLYTQKNKEEDPVIKDILSSLRLSEDCITKELSTVELFEFWSRYVPTINNCGNSRGFNITSGARFGEHMFSISPHKDGGYESITRQLTDETQLKVFIEDDMDNYDLIDLVSLDLNSSDHTMLATFLTTVLEAEDKVICQMNVIYPPSSTQRLRENWFLGMKLLIEYGLLPLKATRAPASRTGPARVGTFLLNIKDEDCQKRYLYY